MTPDEFAGWKAMTESSRFHWVEDEIYHLNGRGSLYYTGGESGIYMRIQKDGRLEAGDYEGAYPHIGEAAFHPRVTRQCKDYSEAFAVAMEAGGKKFLVDMFSRESKVPSVEEATKAYQSHAANHASVRGAEPVMMSEAWVSGKAERPSNIEVYIVNWSTGERPGEWLALPIDSGTLSGLFERIGVGGPAGNDYHIADLRLPFECMSKYVTTRDSLDELNMLAAFITETPDFHLSELQAILTSGVMDVGEGIGALINLLYEDNLHAFNHIYAGTPEEVARYYDRENDEIPDGVSFEEYGKQVIQEEGGAFTPWGYISCRYRELSPLYSGAVPDEYRVVEGALAALEAKAAERPEGKPSVVDQIRAARSTPRSAEEQTPRHKGKGGPEL